jgi:hypothetical protein
MLVMNAFHSSASGSLGFLITDRTLSRKEGMRKYA